MSMLDSIERGFSTVNSQVFKRVNRTREWWHLPNVVALLNLRALRDDLRQFNLYDTRDVKPPEVVPPEELPKYRTYDGARQDPTDPDMGRVGSRFGRNAPAEATAVEPMPAFMEPNPREVSTRLLNRDTFKPATSLNVLAGCWIQFQNHDWFGHGENNPREFLDVPIPDGDEDWPEDPMRVKRTSPDRTAMNGGSAPPDLREHRHPLVGRLADLRLRRGAQPPAAHRRGRQDGGGGRAAAGRGRPQARRAWTRPASATTTGSAWRSCTRCS